MPRRLVDPAATVRDYPAERLGYRSDADQRRGQIARDRNMDNSQKQPVWLFETLPPMWRENVGASDAGSVLNYTMRTMAPSAATTYATVSGFDHPMPAAGVCVVGRIWSSEPRTAGTAALLIRVVEGGTTTDFLFPDCLLDGGTDPTGFTRDDKAAGRLSQDKGIPFAAGALVEFRIQTNGFFTPATADFGAQVTVAYSEV